MAARLFDQKYLICCPSFFKLSSQHGPDEQFITTYFFFCSSNQTKSQEHHLVDCCGRFGSPDFVELVHLSSVRLLSTQFKAFYVLKKWIMCSIQAIYCKISTREITETVRNWKERSLPPLWDRGISCRVPAIVAWLIKVQVWTKAN